MPLVYKVSLKINEPFYENISNCNNLSQKKEELESLEANYFEKPKITLKGVTNTHLHFTD